MVWVTGRGARRSPRFFQRPESKLKVIPLLLDQLRTHAALRILSETAWRGCSSTSSCGVYIGNMGCQGLRFLFFYPTINTLRSRGGLNKITNTDNKGRTKCGIPAVYESMHLRINVWWIYVSIWLWLVFVILPFSPLLSSVFTNT